MIEIHSPALLPDLVEQLEAGGCVARAVGDCICLVTHSAAVDAAEEWSELRFFLRAWQANRGVQITLLPELPVAAVGSG
jgi:hypothetical protein